MAMMESDEKYSFSEIGKIAFDKSKVNQLMLRGPCEKNTKEPCIQLHNI